MLVDECGAWSGGGSLRGGWNTPLGCRAASSMSFGGSVPSLHHTGSIRSLRSQHSTQPSETPMRCVRCLYPGAQTSTPIMGCPALLVAQQQQQQQQHHHHHHHHLQQQQQQSHQYQYTPSHCMDAGNGSACVPPQSAASAHHRHASSSYHGDPRVRCTDLEDSAIGNGNWLLGDLRSLHRCVPALRRTGIDVSGIRMHFYPEGGWGWLVCAAGFLAMLLTSGMQLAFGQLHIHAAKHLVQSSLMDIAWIGSLSAAVSHASAPLVLGTCRRGSTRLTAVIGGLVLALAALFTSFALQPHQVLLSYGVVLGCGAGLVRETANLVLGHYFRKRREFVEMIVQAGTGVGIALFSVSYKEAVGKLGWRLGLQAITGALFMAFFLGLIYRSASLYHPQRHAIVHLKNQQNKLKPKSKSALKAARQPLLDFSPLASRPVRMLMLAAGTASFGLYTPAFYIALQEYQEESDTSASVLLQTCLGLSAALGCAAWGMVTARPSAQCLVSRQYLCQGALVGVAIAQVALGSVQGYHGLVLASGLYGASLGGSLYSLKMLALERLRARQFAKSWALVQAAKALPILVGVPLTGYMNASSPRVGYYACTLSSLCGAALLFLVGWARRNPCSPIVGAAASAAAASAAAGGAGGSLASMPVCACSAANVTPVARTLTRLPKSQSLHIPLSRPETPLHHGLHPGHLDGFHRNSFYGYPHRHFHEQQLGTICGGCLPPQGPLRPSKSVPEGLAQPYHYQFDPQQQSHHQLHPELVQRARTPRRSRDVTVIEQITTSV
ncbi:monocarboxylate transporter 10 isoform X2 [Phymastichus coffea]|uniref:monocarboxylate transporter 10 isoform X2 n=1 Tax=Phymastichus coffea TaxID=108790 RepID=UPI00273CB70B|nr:monocarboxylate transporter 10 isoform X2 [Phymastichus coffea]